MNFGRCKGCEAKDDELRFWRSRAGYVPATRAVSDLLMDPAPPAPEPDEPPFPRNPVRYVDPPKDE